MFVSSQVTIFTMGTQEAILKKIQNTYDRELLRNELVALSQKYIGMDRLYINKFLIFVDLLFELKIDLAMEVSQYISTYEKMAEVFDRAAKEHKSKVALLALEIIYVMLGKPSHILRKL